MRHQRLGQGVLGAALQARDQAQYCLFVTLDHLGLGDPGLALGEGAGLVHHQGGEPAGGLQGVAMAHQYAVLGGLADPDHGGDRRGQPQRAGAGDDQHRGGRDQHVDHPRLGAKVEPGERGGTAMIITEGTKTLDTLSASWPMGGREAWALATCSVIWPRRVFAPTRVAR